jgi:ureidoacrylate peracid hydrolase
MSTAVLVVDMQKGFLDPAGSMLSRGVELFDRERVLSACADLIAAARAGGLPIVYVRHQHRPGSGDATALMYGLYAKDGGLEPGSQDVEFLAAIAPGPHDFVVTKNRYDAFLYTDLDLVLRRLGVDSLIVVGAATHACVECTARSAIQRDLAVSVPGDCCTTVPELQEGALRGMASLGIEVGPWRDVLATATAPPLSFP